MRTRKQNLIQRTVLFCLCLCLMSFSILPVSASDAEEPSTLATGYETEPSQPENENSGLTSPDEMTADTEQDQEASDLNPENPNDPTEGTTASSAVPGETVGSEQSEPTDRSDLVAKFELLKSFPFESIVGFRWETYSEKPLSEIYKAYAGKVGAIYTSDSSPNQDPYYTMISNGFFISSDGYFLTTLRQIEDIFFPTYQMISPRINVKLQINSELTLIPLDLIKVDQEADLVLFKADLASVGIDAVPFVEFAPEIDYSVGQANFGIGFSNILSGEGGLYPGFITEIGIEEVLESGYSMRHLKSSAIIPNSSSGSVIVNSAGQAIGISTVSELRSISDRYSVIYPASQIRSRFAYLFEGENPAGVTEPVIDLPPEAETFPAQTAEGKHAGAGLIFMSDADYLNIQELFKLPSGLYITEVFPNSPAYVTDIRKGDILLSMNNVPVNSIASYREMISHFEPGDSLLVELYRPNLGTLYTKTIYLD